MGSLWSISYFCCLRLRSVCVPLFVESLLLLVAFIFKLISPLCSFSVLPSLCVCPFTFSVPVFLLISCVKLVFFSFSLYFPFYFGQCLAFCILSSFTTPAHCLDCFQLCLVPQLCSLPSLPLLYICMYCLSLPLSHCIFSCIFSELGFLYVWSPWIYFLNNWVWTISIKCPLCVCLLCSCVLLPMLEMNPYSTCVSWQNDILKNDNIRYKA